MVAMNDNLHYIIILLRIGCAGFGCFCLLAPRRIIAKMSWFDFILFFSVMLSYVAIASIRSSRVAKSIWLTVLLSCIAVIPFADTAIGVVSSILKDGFHGADAFVWMALCGFLAVELSLPLVLVFEFLIKKRINTKDD